MCYSLWCNAPPTMLPCQCCVWRAAIFSPCTLHAVTRQMKCTHRRLSSECHSRCHNNPHQSELLKASCWSVILRLHARVPALCCSYLLKCVPQEDRKLVTDKALMRHVEFLVHRKLTVATKNLLNFILHLSEPIFSWILS